MNRQSSIAQVVIGLFLVAVGAITGLFYALMQNPNTPVGTTFVFIFVSVGSLVAGAALALNGAIQSGKAVTTT